jgi:hypothetical protein
MDTLPLLEIAMPFIVTFIVVCVILVKENKKC